MFVSSPFVTKVIMELKDRIATIIRVNNHTASSFADLLDVQRSSISHILNGRNKPSLDFIEKVLLHFPRVDPGWLITGKNPSPKNGHQESPPSVEKKIVPLPADELKGINKKNKAIQKIIIFYSDLTFEVYEQDES